MTSQETSRAPGFNPSSRRALPAIADGGDVPTKPGIVALRVAAAEQALAAFRLKLRGPGAPPHDNDEDITELLTSLIFLCDELYSTGGDEAKLILEELLLRAEVKVLEHFER